MELRAGTRVKSQVCATEVVVVKVEDPAAQLTCGGQPMLAERSGEPRAGDPELLNGSLIGKRYVDEAGTIEVLCTAAGEGSLGLGGALLHQKDAKPLPSSD